MSLYHSFSPFISAAYVLYLPGNKQSERLAQRAIASCADAGQTAALFASFDGTAGEIIAPDHVQSQVWPGWIKRYDELNRLSPTQAACAMGHIALWAHCLTIDHPIVVLEHDAIMLKAYRQHGYPNTIAHLGWRDGSGAVWRMNYTGQPDSNWWFLGGTHGYAIDPLAARRLFTMVMERGIYAPIDAMIRMADIAIIAAAGYVLPAELGSTTSVDRGSFKEPDYER